MAPSQVQSEESIGTRDDSIATDEYNRYLSKLDENYLKELSADIGATYLRATNAKTLIEAMDKQKPAGQDISKFPIARLCIATAMLMVLAGYWSNFIRRFKEISLA